MGKSIFFILLFFSTIKICFASINAGDYPSISYYYVGEDPDNFFQRNIELNVRISENRIYLIGKNETITLDKNKSIWEGKIDDNLKIIISLDEHQYYFVLNISTVPYKENLMHRIICCKGLRLDIAGKVSAKPTTPAVLSNTRPASSDNQQP